MDITFFQAGIALSCWCFKNQDKLKDKFIIELGCGTGLSGISACINCRPSEYWFTDCHTTVLNTLRHNIQINETHHKFNCKYDIVQLSWNDIEDLKMFEKKKPDLILAAGNFIIQSHTNMFIKNYFLDVIFDHTMFEPLCSSLRYFTNNNTTEILLFCTLRNPETYTKFLETLRKKCDIYLFMFKNNNKQCSRNFFTYFFFFFRKV